MWSLQTGLPRPGTRRYARNISYEKKDSHDDDIMSCAREGDERCLSIDGRDGFCPLCRRHVAASTEFGGSI